MGKQCENGGAARRQIRKGEHGSVCGEDHLVAPKLDMNKPSRCSFCAHRLDKVLQMAKEKQELEWEGCKLSF